MWPAGPWYWQTGAGRHSPQTLRRGIDFEERITKVVERLAGYAPQIPGKSRKFSGQRIQFGKVLLKGRIIKTLIDRVKVPYFVHNIAPFLK